MEQTELDTRQTVAGVFNSAVAAAAIGAAWELGALDHLDEHGKLDVEQFAEEQHLDVEATRAVFQALAAVRVVERSGPDIVTGPLFTETVRARALFHWLVQGSGALFAAMPSVVRESNRDGRFYSRDAAAIGYACREINARFFDPIFWSAMAGLDFAFTKVADLGSGSGQRLLEIVRAYPGTTGLGVDIAAPAVEFSTGELAAAGLAERVSFIEADVRSLEPRSEFADVELLTCFMMGHDFWPRANCVATLRRLREVFPSARRFLLGDTARSTGYADSEVPVFTLGFEVAHALMGVRLPTLDDWHGVFDDGGWRCAATHLIDTPAASAIFELEPA